AEALVRWIAPILSFTAEEIWENLPGQRGVSVMLAQWFERLQGQGPDETMGPEYWREVMAVRAAVNREMETQRAAGVIRGSLDAAVTLFCDEGLHARLSELGDELRFVLITSEATLEPLANSPANGAATELDGLRLLLTASPHEKCARCWHRRAEVGRIAAHPGLCERCVENVDGSGEVRHFA
ncbi:MAG: class I tRNA ligase family protein, partial [Halioglobus sp.]|nr:class I tRNA ligase family protein [Halioglobus sp.]